MNTTTKSTWYQANIQYLLSSIDRILQLLTNYIERQENPTTQQLTPEQPLFSSSPPSAIEQLCSTFGLSEGDRDILLLCVGVEIDSNIGRLCGEAQGNLEMNYPTLGLALAALPTVDWNILSAKNPLQRWELIEIAETQTLTQSPIKIDKHILCYLLGEPSIDSQLKGILKPIPPLPLIPLPPSHQKLAEQIVVNWSKVLANTTYPALQLCGAETSAKYAIASTACNHLNFNLSVISAAILPTNPNELNYLIQQCWREAVLTDSAILLDCDPVNSADLSREFAISQFISGLNIPLIISTQERISQHQRLTITLDVNPPTHREQRDIWQSYLGSVAGELNGHIERLVSQFNLTPSTIQAACLSLNNPELETLPKPSGNVTELADTLPSPILNQLWDFCRTQARPQLDDLAQRITASATWEDLVLPEREKNSLRDISLHVRQRAQVYQEWGFAGKGGRGLGISALFSGASGTGKTMAAEVLAHELRLDLYRIDLSAVVSKYIGETEKNLRQIFDAAETSGAILLFDEADALFGKRTQVKDSHDRHANIEVSYLLQRMEAYQGLAILTTNLKESLDGAFLRRIRFVVKFPIPDAEGRVDIWRQIFPHQTPTEGLNFRKLAQLSVAGGNIRNIALNAAFIAADAQEPVMMKHILTAARSEYIKIERLMTDAEIKGWV